VPKLIFAVGAVGKVLPETNVAHVPMRVFRPSREPMVNRLISGRA
jgi:hypothetical protein